MQISTKGQVTIPEDIRRRFGLLPHTEVEFIAEGSKVILKKKKGKESRIRRWLERHGGRANSGFTTEEIMALTRGEKG